MSPTPSGANLLHSVERQEHIGLERPDEVAPDALAAVGHRTALPTREADGDGARHGPQRCRARSSASLSETGKKRGTVVSTSRQCVARSSASLSAPERNAAD